MAIASSEKIFIDAKDEIIFTVERVLEAEKDRIILVVPQNSLLLSSIVSVNILFRQIVKSKKMAIIVTEDEYGTAIASKAGFNVVPKVSQINSEMWESAKSRKQKVLDKLNQRKKELLANISGSDDVEEEKTETIHEADFEETVHEAELNQEEGIENSEEREARNDKVQEPEEIAEEVPAIENEIDESGEDVEHQTSNIEPEEVEYKKPKVEPKVSNINGIEVFGGSDIKNFMIDAENAKIQGNLKETENMTDQPGTRKIKTSNVGSFTGKDFTKAVKGESRVGSFFKNLFKPKRIVEPNERFAGISNANKAKQNRLIIIIIVLLVLFLGGGYVLAFQTSTVNITLTLKKQDVSTSATIVADPNALTVVQTPPTIPGKIIKLDKFSLSKTGTADGNGRSGNKATGLIRLINKTTNAVTLPKGTKLTSVATNLKYQLTSDTKLDAATNTGGVINASIKEDVPIQASDIGPDYNITGSDSNTAFLVDGYSSTDIQATRYADFTGGTLQTFVSVSQDNINKLKASVLTDLKSDATTKIGQMVDDGYILVDGSIDFVESKTTSFPDLNQAATKDANNNYTFNLTLEMNVTALEVKSDDLTQVVTNILRNTKTPEQNTQLQVSDVNIPTVTKVTKDSTGKYTLTVSTQGSLKTQVTPDQMKNDIKGFSMDQLNQYLGFLDYIQDYKVVFTPSFVPQSLQRVPSDLSRIRIDTK